MAVVLMIYAVFAIVGIASLVLSIMTAVSASKYPDWAFQQSGGSKFVWQILPIILIFVCGWAGGVMGLIWFSSKRDEVERAANAGPYGYGAPPQLGYGAPGYTPPGYAPPGYAPPGYPPPPPSSPPPPPPAAPPQ